MDRTTDVIIEDLLRRHAPQVLGALVRRYGHFDPAEDSVQEALIAAAEQWPRDGVPDNPRGWLIRVASRRLTDRLRSDEARRRREETAAALTPADAFVAPPPGEGPSGTGRAPSEDDTLTLLFLCCHPALSPPPRSRSPSARSAVSPRRRSPAPIWCRRRRWRSGSAGPSGRCAVRSSGGRTPRTSTSGSAPRSRSST